jgi:hypothetical protein
MTRPAPSAAVKKDILAAIERGACSGAGQFRLLRETVTPILRQMQRRLLDHHYDRHI